MKQVEKFRGHGGHILHPIATRHVESDAQNCTRPPSEVRVAWPAGEGDDVADVVEACGEEDETLQTQAETAVHRGAVPPEVEVPPVAGSGWVGWPLAQSQSWLCE